MLIDRILAILLKTKVELLELESMGSGEQKEKVKNFVEYFSEECKKYSKTLMMRESQIGALVFIIEHSKEKDFK